MFSRLRWIVPVLLVFVAGQPVRGEGEVPQVRIGLVRGAASLGLSAPQGATVTPLGAGSALSLPAGQTWQALPTEHGVRLLGMDGAELGEFPRGVSVAPAEGPTVMVHGVPGHWDGITDRDYRGAIEIRRDGAGALVAINSVDIETYLRGVVSSEMPPTYPLAALQAQAVAARGQAIMKAQRHAAEGFGLCNGPHCQVYGGATSEHASTDQAVASTRGEVLVYNGRLADTLYSSNCGGHTANNEDYWPGTAPVPYLRGVPDFSPEDKVPYTFPLSEADVGRYLKYAPRVDCNEPRYARTDKIRWWMVIPKAELQKTLTTALGDFGELLDVKVKARAESGMVTRLLVIGSTRLPSVTGGAAARRVMGGLDSPLFAVEPVRGPDGLAVAFIIWGAGWGHQVGMCQVGAAGLADRGWDYRGILSKYYTGAVVERRY